MFPEQSSSGTDTTSPPQIWFCHEPLQYSSYLYKKFSQFHFNIFLLTALKYVQSYLPISFNPNYLFVICPVVLHTGQISFFCLCVTKEYVLDAVCNIRSCCLPSLLLSPQSPVFYPLCLVSLFGDNINLWMHKAIYIQGCSSLGNTVYWCIKRSPCGATVV